MNKNLKTIVEPIDFEKLFCEKRILIKETEVNKIISDDTNKRYNLWKGHKEIGFFIIGNGNVGCTVFQLTKDEIGYFVVSSGMSTMCPSQEILYSTRCYIAMV